LYREADALIALTNAERNIYLGFGVDERKIHVTGNGPYLAPTADGQRFREKYRLGQDPMVLFLGQKYAYKGIEALVKAADFVWRRFPDTRFVFIGPSTPFSELFFSEKKSSRILELGYVDLQEKTDALDACSMLCVPSTQESFGGVYTEAWNFGKPVIGCNIPAVAEVIQNGENGLLTQQESSQIADSILLLLSDFEKARQLGMAGKNKARREYSWESLTLKTQQAYLDVLKERN
jgi:glycosyltransferase involved in cell wall biosynthesis